MNARERIATETLAAGGYFRQRLERDFRGFEKNVTRLIGADGKPVKGVGFVTFHALDLAGKLRARRDAHYGSTCNREWTLAPSLATNA